MSDLDLDKTSSVSNDAELSDQDLAGVIGGGDGTLLKMAKMKDGSADDTRRDTVNIGSFVQKP